MKRIEGIALRHDETDMQPMFIAGNEEPPDHELVVNPALLLISEDGEAPKVLTIEEVKAILKMIIDAREAVRDSPEGMVWATPKEDIQRIAAKFNITP